MAFQLIIRKSGCWVNMTNAKSFFNSVKFNPGKSELSSLGIFQNTKMFWSFANQCWDNIFLLVCRIFQSPCSVQLLQWTTSGCAYNDLSLQQAMRQLYGDWTDMLPPSTCNPGDQALPPRITYEKARQWHRYPLIPGRREQRKGWQQASKLDGEP